MTRQDWIDEHNKKFCTCKNGHRYNSCKGELTCSLRANNPERKTLHDEDLKKLWAGRHGDKLTVCGYSLYRFASAGDMQQYSVIAGSAVLFNWSNFL